MKNMIKDGDITDVVLAAAIVSGAGLKVGSLFGVAVKSGGIGDTVGIKHTGIFDLAYGVAATAAVGDLIYWDDTAKNVTKTTTSNTKVGVCVKAAGSGDATMRVRLVQNI